MAQAVRDRAARRRRPPASDRPRRVRALLSLVAFGFLLAVGGGLALLLPARGALLGARDEMRAGRDALLAGDPGSALAGFRRAEDAFARAGDAAENPLTAFAATLPVIGRTPDAVVGVADAGAEVARAGEVLASGVERLPGGVVALAPRAGTIPVEPLERLAEPLGRAAELAGRANGTASSLSTDMVPAVVAGPVEDFVAEVEGLHQTLRAGHALVRELPSFLGADEPRRYFFGAQNPAELRGTGGLLGAYAILTIRDGRLQLGPFRDVGTLRSLDASGVQPPNADYGEMYDRYGGAGFWKNINMTRDFPSAATAIEGLYRRVEGVSLDGTLLADPAALALLVEATGPVQVPQTDVTLQAEEVVPFLANEAYGIFTDTPTRKRLLGAMAGTVLHAYLSGALQDPLQGADSLIDAAAEGHLLFHSVDPGVQRAFEMAGAAGDLEPPGNDTLAVAVNNAGGNKLDYYMDRSIGYDITLLPDGVAEADVTIDYRSEAPDQGEPAYVIGPFPGASKAGENVMIVSTYCGRCRVHDARENGDASPVGLGEELGHNVIIDTLRVAPGGSASLSYEWTVLGAWDGDANGGTYRLTVQGQPTIRPTDLTIEVGAPPGMVITGADEDVTIEGDVATWNGALRDSMTFEVDVARPLALRILEPYVDLV